ncbi:hypothetical protein HMI56_007532 [Coelomomyces lativittatus]|nr:hypothetical protein HMI56_007532 [Coelomomyces lativittatus]
MRKLNLLMYFSNVFPFKKPSSFLCKWNNGILNGSTYNGKLVTATRFQQPFIQQRTPLFWYHSNSWKSDKASLPPSHHALEVPMKSKSLWQSYLENVINSFI